MYDKKNEKLYDIEIIINVFFNVLPPRKMFSNK